MWLAVTIVLAPSASRIGYAQGNAPRKTSVCHAPPGNPANAHTLTLPEPAIQAHLAHGDRLGPCAGTGTPDPSQTDHASGTVTTETPNEHGRNDVNEGRGGDQRAGSNSDHGRGGNNNDDEKDKDKDKDKGKGKGKGKDKKK
jgi:hypothetical protein